MTGEENYLLLEQIDANRQFMLLAYQSNPSLLKHADESIRRLFAKPEELAAQANELLSVTVTNT